MVLLEEEKEEKRTFPALGPQTGQPWRPLTLSYFIKTRQGWKEHIKPPNCKSKVVAKEFLKFSLLTQYFTFKFSIPLNNGICIMWSCFLVWKKALKKNKWPVLNKYLTPNFDECVQFYPLIDPFFNQGTCLAVIIPLSCLCISSIKSLG